MSRRALASLFLLAGVALAAPARADTSPQDRAAADALYDDAGKLCAANRWAEAIPKLEASLKLDPGLGALLRLAYAYEKTGRSASAWTTFNDVLGTAQRASDKRAKDAADGVRRLEPTLARITIEVAPGTGSAGLEIRRDGTALSVGVLSTPVPVDPGVHVFEATQPGKQKWTTTITIEPKPGLTTVRVPALEDAPPEDKREPAANGSARTWSAQRIAGLSVGGVGAVGVAIGAAIGGAAIGKNNASKADCLPAQPSMCHADGVALRRSAAGLADASTGLFIAGGAALAAGVVVFFTAPAGGDANAKATGVRRVEAAPIAGLGTAGLMLRGEW
jgi:hypothetical protein